MEFKNKYLSAAYLLYNSFFNFYYLTYKIICLYLNKFSIYLVKFVQLICVFINSRFNKYKC